MDDFQNNVINVEYKYPRETPTGISEGTLEGISEALFAGISEKKTWNNFSTKPRRNFRTSIYLILSRNSLEEFQEDIWW